MMKSKTTKIIVNGTVLAGLAALGITVYQIGTAPVKEEQAKELVPMESTEEEADVTEEMPMVDAGTDQVKAELEGGLPAADDLKETSGAVADSTEEADPDTETASTSLEAYAAPEINFSEDTLMEWPVNGNILVDYNMEQTTYFPTLDQYKLSPAIAVQAVEGAPVVAAVNGTVFSVEETAQTGTTVTMELGNGYQAVYGQLTDLMVSEGETVKKGTTIGYVSAPTKYYSKEGSNLYFAMKQNGEAIDPITYLP